jgi:hypothetical protein
LPPHPVARPAQQFRPINILQPRSVPEPRFPLMPVRSGVRRIPAQSPIFMLQTDGRAPVARWYVDDTLYDKVKDSVIYATTDPGTGTLFTASLNLLIPSPLSCRFCHDSVPVSVPSRLPLPGSGVFAKFCTCVAVVRRKHGCNSFYNPQVHERRQLPL